MKKKLTTSAQELETGYKAMAADKERQAEALEWCEAVIGDCLDDDEEFVY